jgi:hypothetical protein
MLTFTKWAINQLRICLITSIAIKCRKKALPSHVLYHPAGATSPDLPGSHRIEGVKVKIFNPAKAVVDCFRYRKSGRS